MRNEGSLNHETRSGNTFSAAVAAKLAKKAIKQQLEQQRQTSAVAAAETTERVAETAERAKRIRDEQALPIRQAAAEKAAATMRADAHELAQTIQQGGDLGTRTARLEARLEKGSKLIDPSWRFVEGNRGYLRQRLFRSSVRIGTTHEVIDIWPITRSLERREYTYYERSAQKRTDYFITDATGLALTSGGAVVNYKKERDTGQSFIINKAVTVEDLAPIEHASEDGVYDPAVIEQWRSLLLAII